MEHKLFLLKIAVWPILVSMATDHFFSNLFYCVGIFAIIYTAIIPKYKRTKKYKQWVADGCKPEDRYKWEDVQ